MKTTLLTDTPVGRMAITGTPTAICSIRMAVPGEQSDGSYPVLAQAATELKEYFEGKRKEFTVPINPEGTEFQRKVWDALRTVPYGQKRSYGQIAAQVGNPKGSRAVGLANNRNPLMIIVPCHRIVGSNGSLTGYAGGLEMKKFLLDLESE